MAQIDALERSASPTTLSRLRLWKNSQLPINRLPQETLILITTHAISTDRNRDRTLILVRVTHVCTQWRRIITACPTLWTRIQFGGPDMSDTLANLFFRRTEGCDLDLGVYSRQPYDPLRTISSSPRNFIVPPLFPGQRIKTLTVGESTWDEIKGVIGGRADALSSLQELELNPNKPPPSDATIDAPIFVGEALKRLMLMGCAILGLDCIRAPNLTVFGLYEEYLAACSVNRLLSFFDASPNLEYVSIVVNSPSLEDFPPPGKKFTLPHLWYISLRMTDSFKVASHLICPSKTDTHFADAFPYRRTVCLFPPDLSSLLGQHTVGVINGVTVRALDHYLYKECSLRLGTSSGTTLRVSRETKRFSGLAEDEMWIFSVLFNQTITALLSLPLDQVVTLSVQMLNPSSETGPRGIKTRLGEVLGGCPNLRELELEHCPPCHFPDLSPDAMPHIQTLVIKCPRGVRWKEFAEKVTEVARIRHSQGAPFKRIKITTPEKRPRIEQLESLVQEVEYLEGES